MADTIHTRALARAAETEGSTQALAGVLHVPENTLLRWMSGRAQMPLRAFLRLVEVLSQHDYHFPLGLIRLHDAVRLPDVLEAEHPRRLRLVTACLHVGRDSL